MEDKILSLEDLYVMIVVMMVSIPEVNEKDRVLFQDLMIIIWKVKWLQSIIYLIIFIWIHNLKEDHQYIQTRVYLAKELDIGLSSSHHYIIISQPDTWKGQVRQRWVLYVIVKYWTTESHSVWITEKEHLAKTHLEIFLTA